MNDFFKPMRAAAMASLFMLLALTGCGGWWDSDSAGGQAAPATSTTAMVGAEGGTVNGPDGVRVVIPAGALDKPTEIGISRSAVGAPTPLPEDYVATAAAPIYEFTPHGIIFNKPVTIRVPTSSSAPNAEILMASPSEDWQATDAVVSGGFAQWQRNSFSWGFVPACAPSNNAPYSSSNPDPYPCSIPSGYASASATPTAAITKMMSNDLGVFSGSAGSWTVNQASTVRLTINYKAAPDCQNPRAKLVRRSPTPQGALGPVQTLFDGPVSLTPTTLTNPYVFGGGSYVRGVGSASYDVAFSHLDNGTTLFGYSFSCNRPFRPANRGGDLMTFVASIPVPTATYTVGGSVSGLSGTGLVLQNSGGDNLPVSANGSFGFATAVGAGGPYAVTVLTQPAGQTCTVQNGSGTANANVSNIVLSCTAGSPAKTWQGDSLLETLEAGDAFDPQVAFDANGNGMAVWSQVSPSGFRDIYVRRYGPGTGWGIVEKIEVPDSGLNYEVPKLALSANGNAVVVFSTSVSEVGIVPFTAKYEATSSSWSAATQLATLGQAAQVAIDTSGNAMAVWAAWNALTGGYIDITARRYEASSNTWQAPRILSTGTGGLSPRIAFDSGGNAMAIWVQTDGINGIHVNRYVQGSGWGTATGLAGSNQSARELDIAVDNVGNIALVWLQNEGTNPFRIYTSFYLGGNWGTSTQVPTSADMVQGPSVAMSGNANAIVVWSEGVADTSTIWARRYVAGVGGTAVRIDAPTTRNAGAAQIAIDGAGNAIAVWNDVFYIWANRYVAGTGWAGPTQIDSRPAGGESLSPEVAVDANGNAIAVWPNTGGLAPTSIWANVFK